MSEIKPEFLLEVWQEFKDYIPVKERPLAAAKMVELFEDNGLDTDDLPDIEGEDRYLDKIIKEKKTNSPEDMDEY